MLGGETMGVNRRQFMTAAGATLGASSLAMPAIAQARTAIRIGYLHTLAVDGQLWLSQHLGAWSRQRLDPQFKEFTTGLELFNALNNGGVDVLVTGAVISNNIIANPTPGLTGVFLNPWNGAPATVSCNDVWNFQFPWSGIPDPNGTNGNFVANPRFCDPLLGNYQLDAVSPCAPGQHPNGTNCGLIGAYPVGCALPVAVGDAPLESMPLVVAQPNPSHGQVSFALAPGAEPVRIRIVDAAGRSVREIAVPASSAPRSASWDQTDASGHRVASGVYFYRVQSGRRESTKQLVVLN